MFEVLLIGIVMGLGLAGALWLLQRRRPRTEDRGRLVVQSSIESIKAVGELVVLKVFTQQIVTKTDHLMGEWGEKWMAWLLSSKKTAMIFDFVVDFRYDLRHGRFEPKIVGERDVEFIMPPCHYEIQLKNLSIYDERASALVPVLLPEWIGQLFGGRFTEREKNQLINAARQEAQNLARQIATRMTGDVQRSAEQTLRQIARAMGFEGVVLKFSSEEPVIGMVDVSNIEKTAREAVSQ